MAHRFVIAAALLLTLIPCQSFVFAPLTRSNPSHYFGATRMASSATKTDYDVVKVDLSDGRDYPIYIGAGFTHEQGTQNHISHWFMPTPTSPFLF
jgi:hypothetical protein